MRTDTLEVPEESPGCLLAWRNLAGCLPGALRCGRLHQALGSQTLSREKSAPAWPARGTLGNKPLLQTRRLVS